MAAALLLVPAVAYGVGPFDDVPEGQFYTEAVLWAADNGITTGTSANTFSPNDPVTRAQNVTFAKRYDDNIVQPALEDLGDDIDANTASIATNAANIASNDADIATNATGVGANAADIDDAESDIATNAADIDALEAGGFGGLNRYFGSTSVDSGDPFKLTITCPAGETIIAGGYRNAGAFSLSFSYPSVGGFDPANSWVIGGNNTSGFTSTFFGDITCAQF